MKAGAGLVIAALVVAGALYLYWPVRSAMNAYSLAETANDRDLKCRAAGEVALAFAHLGMDGSFKEWKQTEEHDCAYSRFYASLGEPSS